MRLAKIKLAGFKSFVDPTNIGLPSNLIGVVGPNGCGKSNVIDAVRWVMGESSAKHLRGDSMADVIFNGSNSRKPVGVASIELCFDNSDGALEGQYASYSEISIRRQVGRDGQSSYFLNGARCRRRDITDIFLGTGLGPRSYAIIEQGTISRIIEAKPEELRVFIEEAAGISKYKERRRDTENRMRHTRENLLRLNDLREEVEKQIQRLQRQSRTAKRYKQLKEEERLLKAQHLALRWAGFNRIADEERRRSVELETVYEAGVARQRALEAETEKQREAHTEVSDLFNKLQARYYAVGGEVSQVEQTISHRRERQDQIRQELERTQKGCAEAGGHVRADQEQAQTLKETLARDEPGLERLREREQAARERFNRAEETLREWQSESDEFNHQAAETERAAEVERTRIQHLEQRMVQSQNRASQLQQEMDGLDTATAEQEMESLIGELREADAGQSRLEMSLQELRGQMEALRGEYSKEASELQAAQETLHRSRGRIASLETLQEAALGNGEGEIVEWLEAQGLEDRQRLAQTLEVESGWEVAVETVLGSHLESVCVDGFEGVVDAVGGIASGGLGLLDTRAEPPRVAGGSGVEAVPLAEKIQAPWPIHALLNGVHAVENLEEGLALYPRLAAHESVVTRSGEWLGGNWLRIDRNRDEKEGVLVREQELRELTESVKGMEADVEERNGRQRERQTQLERMEAETTELQSRLATANRVSAELQSQIGGRQARLEQVRSRIERIGSELKALQIQKGDDEEELGRARRSLEVTLAQMGQLQERREALTKRRDDCRNLLEEARREWHAAREQAHGAALKVEGMRSRFHSLEESLARVKDRIRDLNAHREELNRAFEESEAPLREAKADLDRKLAQRVEVEAELKAGRQRLEDADEQLRTLDRKRRESEEEVLRARGELEKSRVDCQATQVRLQTLQEQLAEHDFTLDALQEGMPEEATEEAWQTRIEEMERKISRLGPINLAAIDEFAQESERKEYLDSQHEDLTSALTTLENAIRKIDRETRTRFKETFDRVNAGIKSMFPRLIGGGHAYLELTSDDLLEAGVGVMARPPGKRITTINLLSGGEKALTAVALVFAIFELNPAPFCMLDEVDAPLDDANVARFCDLVRSMSDRVQFIIITHNKVTMEMTNHLIGVTMNEPGVSRLVAVDLESAVEMAGHG